MKTCTAILFLLFAKITFAFTPQVSAPFKIEPFVSGINNPRALAVSDDEKYVFAGSRDAGNVYAVEVGSKKIITVASGLNLPTGIAYHQDDLYVAEVSRIIKFTKISEQLKNRGSSNKALAFEVAFDKYPKDTHHGWKHIAFGPDGNLYVPVGAPCNICEKPDPYASITKLDLKNKSYAVVARGVRNTVGFDWDASGKLWFTDNGRDYMGDDLPPCEVNRLDIEQTHFGYPFCHGDGIKDLQFGNKDCKAYQKPQLNLPAHSAPLGIHFYRGKLFAKKYQNGFFVAEHGSWNRSKKSGYRILFFSLNKQGDAQTPETVVEGFLDGQKTLGRPVAFATLKDGSLLISDDYSDQIWRLSIL